MRNDKSVIGQWWHTVDRWVLGAFLLLALLGLLLVSAASPSVAERLHLQPFYFVHRHIAFLIPSLAMMVGASMLSPRMLWRVASLTLVVALFLVLVSIFFGVEIKGATRWVRIFGFSLQPSEFIKPAFAVTSAWLIAKHRQGFPGHQLSFGLLGLSLLLLMLQPDFGMSTVVACIWGAQVFLAGLPLLWIFALGGVAATGAVGAYMFFPHVTSRIDRFLDPASGDNYQVQKSLDAFSNGGLFGTGPAHGQVKFTLPDAHADFIFAVAGEELGLLATLFIVAVFCFIILRSAARAINSEDAFVLLGAGGLLTQFALQSLIHMGSSLQLLPAKGMTLPFISYGGSSAMALGLGMGMLLALTRRRQQAASGSIWKNWMQEEKYG
jgi:cell division protein FtsW